MYTSPKTTENSSATERPASLWRFSIAELLVFTALLAGCLMLWPLDPIGCVMLVLNCLLASIRTIAAKRLAQRKGAKLSIPRQIGSFTMSVLLVYASTFLAGMTLSILAIPLILLYPGNGPTSSDPITWLIMIAGMAVFFYIQYRFLKATWPK